MTPKIAVFTPTASAIVRMIPSVNAGAAEGAQAVAHVLHRRFQRLPSHMSRTSSLTPATGPKAWSAARRGRLGRQAARATFCAVSMSRWNCSSMSSSRSNRCAGAPTARAAGCAGGSSGLRQHPGDGAGNPLPVLFFGGELLPAGPGQLVELRRPVGLGGAPLRLDPASFRAGGAPGRASPARSAARRR